MQRCVPVTVAMVMALFLGLSHGNSLDAQLYEDLLMEDLYKRLAMMDDLDYPGWQQEEQPIVPAYSEGISLDSRGDGEAMIRDSEYVEHSSNAGSKGFIHMSGGAGEGMQHLMPEGTQNNRQEVKSDEALPFYCHPPNPCPKGYSPTSDECIDAKLFKDTAESQKMWIKTMMSQGLCSCDQEHMFECPTESAGGADNEIGAAKGVESREDFDAIFNNLLDEDMDQMGPSQPGLDKRLSRVAKKSPRIKRDLGADRPLQPELEKRKKWSHRDNPYLRGEKLRTAAKKGIGYN